MPTISELKSQLKKQKLPTSGNKETLIERLKESKKIPNNVIDPSIYLRAKNKIKSKMRWPSAYASSHLVKLYKKMGGRYRGKKSKSNELTRWHREKWTNVCTGGPCGREKSSTRKYPYCRPSIRVSKATPRTINEIKAEKDGPVKLKQLCKQKTSKNRIYV